MRTVEQILRTKRATSLQKQLILGFCKQAGIKTEQQLNQRKIHNRQIFNNCVNALNKANKTNIDEKDYINIVQDINDLEDEHDIYVVSTTFGLKFYNLITEEVGTPAMKLQKMLDNRCNTLDTCYVHSGTHKNLSFIHFTGMLLQYTANKYYKTNNYQTITEKWNGYKV